MRGYTGLAAGGSFTALPTPFHAGAIDDDGLARLCERQVDRGTAALVVCGSTGEAASLRPEEHRLAIRIVAEAAAGRNPVIAGCGASSTDMAVELAVAAVHGGANALLCAPPSYVKPTQDGIIGHMKAIQRAAQLPVMIYDVPSRTGVSITDDTLARLYEEGVVFGLKDATADLARPPRLRALCGESFLQMSGDDGTAAAYRAAGGHGCISVTANVAPALCSLLHRSWDDRDLDDFAAAREQAGRAERPVVRREQSDTAEGGAFGAGIDRSGIAFAADGEPGYLRAAGKAAGGGDGDGGGVGGAHPVQLGELSDVFAYPASGRAVAQHRSGVRHPDGGRCGADAGALRLSGANPA